jgi:hypothetical protein
MHDKSGHGAEATDYLIAHHDRLQSEADRRPIRFGARHD